MSETLTSLLLEKEENDSYSYASVLNRRLGVILQAIKSVQVLSLKRARR